MSPIYSYKSTMLAIFFGGVLCTSQGAIAAGGTEMADQGQPRLHVVFNNVPYKAGLESGWGFSCLIEGLDKTVLFDTGCGPMILLRVASGRS